MAVTNKTFADLITFTRSGATATRVNSAGLIETVAADTPRFDYDPVTGAAKGLLIEEARTNLLVRSEEFDSANWTKNGTGLGSAPVVTPNAAIAPDGTVSADRVDFDLNGEVGSGWSWIYQNVSIPSLTDHSTSIYVKPVSQSDVGKVIHISGVGGSENKVIAAGWQRLVFSATNGSTGTYSVGLRLRGNEATADSISLYVWGAQLEVGAFPTSYIPTRGSFTSRASTATYFDSEGVLQTAAINEARTGYKLINGTWTSMGLLLEAAATNLLLRSEEFDSGWSTGARVTVSANQTVAPDGATTADELIETGSTEAHYCSRTVTVTASTVLVASCYVKRGSGSRNAYIRASNDGANRYAFVNLGTGALIGLGGVVHDGGVIDVGGGWYRVWFSWTTGADTSSGLVVGLTDSASAADLPSYTGDGTSSIFAWGAQVEEGSYPTSYIKTEGSTVTRSADVSSSSTATRAADVAVIEGTAFSDWYNASEGTVYVEAASFAPAGGYRNLLILNDGTLNERNPDLAMGTGVGGGSGTFRCDVFDGGAQQAGLGSSAAYIQGAYEKAAFAFKVNDFAFCHDGGTVGTDTSGTVPTPTKMEIGNRLGSSQLNGHIKDIRFYPTRLSNSELQELTS